MTSRVPDVFGALARQLNIPPADVAMLQHFGMTTADEFFFRLPEAAKLEEWLAGTARVRACVDRSADGGPADWRIGERLDELQRAEAVLLLEELVGGLPWFK